jgi:hypothetical protein
MSVKATILDNLETALKGIKQTGGYNMTVQKVERYHLAFDEDTYSAPFISIVETGEIPTAEDGSNMQLLLSLSLLVFLRDSNTMAADTDKIVDDIKKLIYSPVGLGTYCLDIRHTGIEQLWISETEKKSATRIGIDILYYAAKASF